MQAVTLALAGSFGILVMFFRPTRALALYFILLLAYPTFLVVQVGALDIGAARIVGGVLLMRCLFNRQIIRTIKWCALDKWILFSVAVTVGVPLIAWKTPQLKVLENRSGFLMDTFMAYFIARFCISDYRALKTVAKWVAPVIVGLAILGAVESLYGIQPFFALRRFCPWRAAGEYLQTNVRLGYFRAVGPAGNEILFGAAFVMFIPIIWTLRHEAPPWRTWAYIVAGFATVGALSSMSSGPWMMVITLWGCLILENFKSLVKPIVVFVIGSSIAVDIMSDRTIYHVLASYANPVGGTGWHRAKLIDLAIEHFGEWWMLGYGGQDPGWGSRLGMTWTDLTSHYILSGVLYGAWGVIALLGVLISAMILLVRAGRDLKDPVFRSWCWAFGSLMVVLIISFTSCAFFDQSHTYFYGMLGVVASIAQGQRDVEQATRERAQRVPVVQRTRPGRGQIPARG